MTWKREKGMATPEQDRIAKAYGRPMIERESDFSTKLRILKAQTEINNRKIRALVEQQERDQRAPGSTTHLGFDPPSPSKHQEDADWLRQGNLGEKR